MQTLLILTSLKEAFVQRKHYVHDRQKEMIGAYLHEGEGREIYVNDNSSARC